jgi:hypothetical protein
MPYGAQDIVMNLSRRGRSKREARRDGAKRRACDTLRLRGCEASDAN